MHCFYLTPPAALDVGDPHPIGKVLVDFTDHLGPKGLSDVPQFQGISSEQSLLRCMVKCQEKLCGAVTPQRQ